MAAVVKAYMMSFVAQQCVVLPRQKLAERYPHSWLVWEPGGWAAARPDRPTTMIPRAAGAEPAKGDALCFELTPPPKGEAHLLGRAPTCQIVLNDATVSREHLRLTLESDHWWLSVASATQGVRLNEANLGAGAAAPLKEGAQLRVGEVTLSFYGPQGFLARAEREARRL